MKINKHPVAVTTASGGIKTAIARNATASGEVDSNELAKLFDKRLATPRRSARPRSSSKRSARRSPACWSVRTPRCSTSSCG